MLLKEGFEVDLFEEHSSIGFPIHCAGVISLKTFFRFSEVLGGRSVAILENVLKGVRIGIPGGTDVQYVDNRGRAVVVNRLMLDRLLAEVFIENGGNLHLNSKVREISEGKISLITGDSRKFDVLIDARGVKSFIERRKGGFLPAIQVEVESSDLERDVVEIWFDKKRNPYFFYWVCPVSENVARIGTASPGNLHELVEFFIKSRFGRVSRLRYYYGNIIISGPAKPFVDGFKLYVGDSAGQTKPLTGGGLRYGFSGAREASKAIISRFSEGTSLKNYEDQWFKKWGGEIDVQRRIREIYEKLTAHEILEIIREVDVDLLRFAVSFEEMDRFKETIQKIVGSKALLRKTSLILKLIKYIIKI